ncbi:MAG TPA: glucosamine-6-phosphate deaminase [Vicinamibacterales bacterium]|nr:glucosamine-6-phosphate deaminase [Vicinamibacterales bacterium]
MRVRLFDATEKMALDAADQAARSIRAALAARGSARIIAATGASQFRFLAALTRAPEIDWSRVELFHLDEYIGLPADHPASFRRFLLDRLIRPAGIHQYHLLDGEADPDEVCAEVGRALQAAPVDVAFAGIGENGHLAFNDPPADFDTDRPYLVVGLDEACRRQQVGEGWFPSLADVPAMAISMSIRQIMAAAEILCIVPESRKARAVQAVLEGEVTPAVPASILRRHPNTTLYLDRDSASRLEAETVKTHAVARPAP